MYIHMFMQAYPRIHVYTHAHAHTHTYTHLHMDISIQRPTAYRTYWRVLEYFYWICLLSNKRRAKHLSERMTDIQPHTFIHTYTHTHAHTHSHTHSHTEYTHTYGIHTHIHSYTHTHTHIHTHTRRPDRCSGLDAMMYSHIADLTVYHYDYSDGL